MLLILLMSAMHLFADDLGDVAGGSRADFSNTIVKTQARFGHRSVARVYIDGVFNCSAFLTSPCVLVSASHCFHTGDGIKSPGVRKEGKITVVFPGKDPIAVEYDGQPRFKGMVKGKMRGEVTGLIAKKPIVGVPIMEIGETGKMDLDKMQGQPMEMLGYVRNEYVATLCREIKINEKKRTVHGCTLIPGMSGGPCVVRTKAGRNKAIGTNSFLYGGTFNKNGFCVLLPKKAHTEIQKYKGPKCEKVQK